MRDPYFGPQFFVVPVLTEADWRAFSAFVGKGKFDPSAALSADYRDFMQSPTFNGRGPDKGYYGGEIPFK